MKTIKILFLLIPICFFLSCSSDSDDDENVSCTEEISFTEDGVAITYPLLGATGQPTALFQLKDPSPFDPNGVSRGLVIRMVSGTSILDIVLELNVDGPEACLPVGVYNTETLDANEGVISFTYIKGTESYIAGLGLGNASLEITRCDFDNGLISGNISGTLMQSFGSGSIVITNGDFKDICIDK